MVGATARQALDSLGPINELRINFDFIGFDGDPYDNPALLLDNLTLTA